MVTNNPEGVHPEGQSLPTPRARQYVAEAEFPEAKVRVDNQQYEFQGVILEANDPFESALSDLIRIYRHRKPVMAIDGDIYATFRQSAAALNLPQFGIPESLLHHLTIHQAAINAMRQAGTLFDPENGEALGSYFEMAFFSAMLYSWIKGWSKSS